MRKDKKTDQQWRENNMWTNEFLNVATSHSILKNLSLYDKVVFKYE